MSLRNTWVIAEDAAGIGEHREKVAKVIGLQLEVCAVRGGGEGEVDLLVLSVDFGGVQVGEELDDTWEWLR